jgi:hypothetical protein
VGSGWRRRGPVGHGCRHGCEAGNGDDDDDLLALLRWSGGVGEERTPVRDGRAERSWGHVGIEDGLRSSMSRMTGRPDGGPTGRPNDIDRTQVWTVTGV